MAVIDTILSLVKVLLEVPSESNYSDTDLQTLITEAYKSVKKDLRSLGVYFNPTSEEITLTDTKQYTLTTTDIDAIISLTVGDDYEYIQVNPAEWPTKKERIYWFDKKNNQINFFRIPENQGVATLLVDVDDGTLEDLDSEYNLLVALKAAILIAASEKEKVDGLKELYGEERERIHTDTSIQPRFVREIENPSSDYGDIV